MLTAVLYHHWLDLRFVVFASLGPWIAFCVLTALVPIAVVPDASPVAVHAWALSIGVVAAGLAFGGTGIRPGLEINNRSVYYTLTLPVSRWMLGAMRLLAGAGVGFIFVFGLFAVVAASLWLSGREVPLVSMAVSMLLGLALVVNIQAATGLVLPLVTERFSPALTALVPFVVILQIGRALNDSSAGWTQVVRFLQFDPVRWDIVAVLLLSIAVSLAAAGALMRIREF